MRNRETSQAKNEGDGQASGKLLEMSHFQALTHLKEPLVAPSWDARFVPNRKNEKIGSDGSG
jgi:hypothetical protein